MERFRCEDFPWCRKKEVIHPQGTKSKHKKKNDHASSHLQNRKSNTSSGATTNLESDCQSASGSRFRQNLGELATTSESAILSCTHWVWWVFSMVVIPLLRDHFYVTEREGSLQTVVFIIMT